ncbi:MAG: sugar-transfer associated ATP-grasp domain-containing protein, partial [Candidatus Rokuibacteriota bacterium]
GPGLLWDQVPSGEIAMEGIHKHFQRHPRLKQWLVEERLLPHPKLAAWAPEVIHTARILTALDGGEPIVFAAAFRIAIGDKPTDNFSQGNIVAPIDVHSGRLGEAAYKSHGKAIRLTAHPVSSAPISGETVPFWREALGAVKSAARLLPWIPLLGWDVAVTASGPVIVEANTLWDPDVTQIASDTGLLVTPLFEYMRKRGLFSELGVGIGLGAEARSASI